MDVREACSKKVVTIRKDNTLIEAARSMREHHVGDLVVVESRGEEQIPIGILTDRDIVVAVIAKDMDHFHKLAVGDVMSFDLVTAHEDDNLGDILERMGTCGVRRVPVVTQSGTVVGILTFDDIVCLLGKQMKDLATLVCSQTYREREERD